MANSPSPGMEVARAVRPSMRLPFLGHILAATAVVICLLTPITLPKGYAQAVCADTLEFMLVSTCAFLAFQNSLRTHARVRIFWFLTFLGAAIWAVANSMWVFYEVFLHRPPPTSPLMDVLIFVMIVPLTTAFAAAPHRQSRSPFRAFGLMDVSILMIYALYLYGFGVFSYLLLPNAVHTYNFRFNIADAIGNQIFVICAAVALLVSHGPWKSLYRLYFLSAASFALSTDLINTAIDRGVYSSGSFFDLPLVISLAGMVCVMLQGRSLGESQPQSTAPPGQLPGKTVFLSSHLAMLVTLSTPLIGVWLLSGSTAAPLLRFRLTITLVTMFSLALLLSVKENLLTSGLVQSLTHLSENYASIERFKSSLSESERMASLGELVADVAIHIKHCMAVILDLSGRLASRPDVEARVQGMAGKIGQHAQRTDALVDNMLHFAQETPMRPAPVEVKPLLESALQLSRTAKSSELRITLTAEGPCPAVLADSSQLLRVFLELISNAVDALQEVNGGFLEIKISPTDSQVVIEFNDSGPGLKEPTRVFEPFYTTKVVGKGTGLGLSTCYGILQQHRGEITCRNRLTGGACFTIRLPFASSSSEDNKSAVPMLEGAI